MSLVAIQQASGFWSKMGFTRRDDAAIDNSYAADATFMVRDI